ncbi:MAG: TM1812 family CRISPR-associated protein [Acidilobaceae archaeon]
MRSLRRDLGIETGSEQGDIRRNFFAHSGLASDVIDYQVIEGRIYIRYRESRLNEIRSWLELDVGSLA